MKATKPTRPAKRPKVRRTLAITVNPWHRGNPPTSGYYLASWKFGNTRIASELWYNPETGWWPSRGYLNSYIYPIHNPQPRLITTVYAWMPVPQPLPFG